MLMPPSSGSGILGLGPRGDLGYAVFVALVLLLSGVGAVIFYRRSSAEEPPEPPTKAPEQGPGQAPPG